MSPRPGVEVISRAAPSSPGIPTDTGTWFAVGTTEKGPLDKALLIRSIKDYETHYGARRSGTTVFSLWDALQVFFREGGTRAYVARTSGATAATAGRTLVDASAGNSLRIDAKNPGTWGNALSVQVVAGSAGGTFVLVISHSTLGEVERSPDLEDQAAAVQWSLRSNWVTVSIPGGASALDPAVAAAAALTGGADDFAGVTDTERVNALNRFVSDYGPGSVSVPTSVSTTVRNGLRAHAKAYNRVALLDGTDTASASSLVTEGAGLQGNEYSAVFAPWLYVPGVETTIQRVVPPSAAVAGLLARSDAQNSPNEPVAGRRNGIFRYVTDLKQPGWTDAERASLNEAGVNVIRNFRGDIQLYGFRSLDKLNGQWLALSNVRMRTKIVAEAENIAEQFLFTQLDGRGLLLADFQGALAAMLTRYYDTGALFGERPEDAFIVDVGEGVNTPTTLANNELRAVISLRLSPMAELVTIEIVKVSVAENLAA